MVIYPFSLTKASSTVNLPDFDDLSFDEKVRYARDEPLVYALIVETKLTNFINSIPDKDTQLKMKRVQFRLNRELRKYKDPLARFNKVVSLFWEQVNLFIETTKRV